MTESLEQDSKTNKHLLFFPSLTLTAKRERTPDSRFREKGGYPVWTTIRAQGKLISNLLEHNVRGEVLDPCLGMWVWNLRQKKNPTSTLFTTKNLKPEVKDTDHHKIIFLSWKLRDVEWWPATPTLFGLFPPPRTLGMSAWWAIGVGGYSGLGLMSTIIYHI